MVYLESYKLFKESLADLDDINNLVSDINTTLADHHLKILSKIRYDGYIIGKIYKLEKIGGVENDYPTQELEPFRLNNDVIGDIYHYINFIENKNWKLSKIELETTLNRFKNIYQRSVIGDRWDKEPLTKEETYDSIFNSTDWSRLNIKALYIEFANFNSLKKIYEK